MAACHSRIRLPFLLGAVTDKELERARGLGARPAIDALSRRTRRQQFQGRRWCGTALVATANERRQPEASRGWAIIEWRSVAGNANGQGGLTNCTETRPVNGSGKKRPPYQRQSANSDTKIESNFSDVEQMIMGCATLSLPAIRIFRRTHAAIETGVAQPGRPPRARAKRSGSLSVARLMTYVASGK